MDWMLLYQQESFLFNAKLRYLVNNMHRRARHLPFSLGSGTNGAKLVLYAPAMRGYADGDPVGTWPDLSGNGYDVTSTGSNRPTYGKLGGVGSVVFSSSSNQYLERATAPTPVNATVISAVAPISWNDSGPNVIGSVGYADSNAPSAGLIFGCTSLPTNIFDWVRGDAIAYGSGWAGNPRAVGPCPSGSDARIISVQLGSSSRYFSNGERQSTRVETTGTNTYNGTKLIIGKSEAYSAHWNGRIAYVAWFGQIISDALRQRIQQSSGFTFRIATK